MNPGEYVGEDGRTYRWEKQAGCYFHRCLTDAWRGAPIFDWPKAKAALDALIESEQEEWVELDDYRRIRPDGTEPQHRTYADRDWQVSLASTLWVVAFRAGLKTGQEKVRELAELVEQFVRLSPDGEHFSIYYTDNNGVIDSVRRLLTLAKAVKG